MGISRRGRPYVKLRTLKGQRPILVSTLFVAVDLPVYRRSAGIPPKERVPFVHSRRHQDPTPALAGSLAPPSVVEQPEDPRNERA